MKNSQTRTARPQMHLKNIEIRPKCTKVDEHVEDLFIEMSLGPKVILYL